MPNHIQNKIIFKGSQEKLKKLYSRVITKSKDGPFFNFNKIVPVPKDFDTKLPSSPDTRMGFVLYVKALFLGDTITDYILANNPIFLGGNMSAEEEMEFIEKTLTSCQKSNQNALEALKIAQSKFEHLNKGVPIPISGSTFFDFLMSDVNQWNKNMITKDLSNEGISCNQYDVLDRFCSTEKGKELFSLGERAFYNIQNHSALTWYEWNCINWGTKWNSYDNKISPREIKFCTAWSCPVPIVQKLAEIANEIGGITFIWMYADEDIGNNDGIFVFKGSSLQEMECDAGSDQAFWVASECWGTTNESETIFPEIEKI